MTADLHAKISDFGIATRFGMEHSPDMGTTRYMAPEVIFGPYDESADVYSFGARACRRMQADVYSLEVVSECALAE